MFRNIFKKVRNSKLISSISSVPRTVFITVPITGAVTGYRSVEEQTASTKTVGVIAGVIISLISFPIALFISPIYFICYVLTLGKNKVKPTITETSNREIDNEEIMKINEELMKIITEKKGNTEITENNK